MPIVSNFSGGGVGGSGGYPTSAGWKDPRTGIAREAIAKDEPIVLERYGDIDAGEMAGALTYDETSMALISPTQQFMAISINHAGTIIICLHAITEYLELTFSAYKIDRETDTISFIGKYGTGYTAAFSDSMCIGAVEWSKDDTYFSLFHRQGVTAIIYKVDAGNGSPVFTKLADSFTGVTAFHWSKLADSRAFILYDSTIGTKIASTSYTFRQKSSSYFRSSLSKIEISTSNSVTSTTIAGYADLGITDGLASGTTDYSTYYRYYQGSFGFAMNADESGFFLICGYLNMYRRSSGGSYSEPAGADFYYYGIFGMSSSGSNTYSGYAYQHVNIYYYDIRTKKKLNVYGAQLAQNTICPAWMFNPDAIRYFPEQKALWIRNGSTENGGSFWEIRKIVPNDAMDGFLINGALANGERGKGDATNTSFAVNLQRSMFAFGQSLPVELYDISQDGGISKKIGLSSDEIDGGNRNLAAIYSFPDDGVYITAQIKRNNKYRPFAYKLSPKTYIKTLRDIYAMGELSHATFTEYGIGAAQEAKEAGQEIKVNLFPELNNRLGGKVNR